MLHDGRPMAAMAIAAAGLVALSLEAVALDEPPGEMAALKACEKEVCTLILDKAPSGDDLTCKMSKTWARNSIKKGENKGVAWGFGDARCKVSLSLSRADVIAALTRPAHTITSPPLTVKCEVERGDEVKPVTAKAQPKLVFKDGKAEKVWINLKEIDGPVDIKGTIWTAASLEDTLGIFHKSLIKSINKFVHKRCPKTYGSQAQAQKDPPKAPSGAATATSAKPAEHPPPADPQEAAAGQ